MSGETREEFVRRHWDRSGVVVNGVTLLDLYSRINELENRILQLESSRGPNGDGIRPDSDGGI